MLKREGLKTSALAKSENSSRQCNIPLGKDNFEVQNLEQRNTTKRTANMVRLIILLTYCSHDLKEKGKKRTQEEFLGKMINSREEYPPVTGG